MRLLQLLLRTMPTALPLEGPRRPRSPLLLRPSSVNFPAWTLIMNRRTLTWLAPCLLATTTAALAATPTFLHTFDAGRGNTVQDRLDTALFAPGDVILVTGMHADGFTVDSVDTVDGLTSGESMTLTADADTNAFQKVVALRQNQPPSCFADPVGKTSVNRPAEFL